MRKLIEVSFLLVVLLSFKRQDSKDWIEPMNIDLEHLEEVFLNKINHDRNRRRAPSLIKDEGWDSAAVSTYERCYRYKFNSSIYSMKRRMDKHYKKHKREFETVEKMALIGAAEYPAMKVNSSRYFYDEKRNAEFPFFYGYKSSFKRDNSKPTPITRKTYDELADQLIRTVAAYNNGDIYRKTVSKIGLKFGLSKKRRRERVPSVKVIVYLGCNTMATLKI